MVPVPEVAPAPKVAVVVKAPARCPGTVNVQASAAVGHALASLGALYSQDHTPVTGQPDPEPTSGTGQTSAQPSPAFPHEKVKSVNRSFKVKSSDKLSIDNQFGLVNVQTWTRPEVVVEVTIIARAEMESKAQEILDKINVRVSDERASGLISFVTEREPMHIRSSTQKSFEINYLVKMPRANPLRVTNKYGSVQLPDLDGPTELCTRYGKLTAGRLNNRANKISIDYSSGECQIGYLRGGDLAIKYSALRLNGGETINAYTAYSAVSIDRVEDLNVESRYDRVFKVGSVNQVNGKGSYSSFVIDNLKGSAGMEVKYCSKFEIGSIDQNFKKVDVTSGYTSVKLGFADKSAFNFDVNTDYSNLKVDQNLVDFSFREVKNTSASYKGKYGKASPRGTVSVNSRYGNVQFY